MQSIDQVTAPVVLTHEHNVPNLTAETLSRAFEVLERLYVGESLSSAALEKLVKRRGLDAYAAELVRAALIADPGAWRTVHACCAEHVDVLRGLPFQFSHRLDAELMRATAEHFEEAAKMAHTGAGLSEVHAAAVARLALFKERYEQAAKKMPGGGRTPFEVLAANELAAMRIHAVRSELRPDFEASYHEVATIVAGHVHALVGVVFDEFEHDETRTFVEWLEERLRESPAAGIYASRKAVA